MTVPMTPEQVSVHDFTGKKLGKAIPYGVYDIVADAGWVSVGTDADTARFAVSTLRTWWNRVGKPAYPHASRLLITADSGGSTAAAGCGCGRPSWPGSPTRPAWPSPYATCRPAPPDGTKSSTGCSASSPRNWRARPLTSHEVVINTIAATTTKTGLTITAELDTGTCPWRHQDHRP